MHKSDYEAYYLAKELIDEFFMTASEFFTNYLERKHMSEALILDMSNASAPVIRRMEGQEAEAFINQSEMGKADSQDALPAGSLQRGNISAPRRNRRCQASKHCTLGAKVDRRAAFQRGVSGIEGARFTATCLSGTRFP